MPQPRQSTRLVQKTLTRLPSEGRAGRVPTSSEGRANAQPDDSSRSRLLKPEFDVSEDAVNKAPHPTLSPRRLGKGAQPQTSPGRPRQVKAPEQVEEGHIPSPLLPVWTRMSWVTQTLTCSKDAERPGSPRRPSNRLAEPEAGRLRAGPLTTKLTLVEQGAFRLRWMTPLHCRPGQGPPGAAGKPGFSGCAGFC